MSNSCPECGGLLKPRATHGLLGCVECGKIVAGRVDSGDELVETIEAEPEPGTDPDHKLVAVDEVLVPDYTEVMIGWRAWGVSPDLVPGKVPLLRSVGYGDKNDPDSFPIWRPGIAMEAECATPQKHGKSEESQSTIPWAGCSCGLYAARTREHLQEMKYQEYDAEKLGLYKVMGTVNAWGRMREGTFGWRHQYAYPRELFVPYEANKLAAPLAKAYQVPVRLDNILT